MAISSPPQVSSSPGRDGPLSPNSKIAKMLADIDRQFEEDPNAFPLDTGEVLPSVAAETTAQKSPEESIRSPPQQPASTVPFQQHSDADSQHSDDDDEIRRPQGRAARRMFANQQPNVDSPPSSPPITKSQRSQGTAELEDEDLYTSTPIKRTGASRGSSRSPSVSQSGSGLFVSPTKSRADQDSDSDLPVNIASGSDRLKELIAQKRAERLAREAEERDRRKNGSSAPSSDLPGGDAEGPEDKTADPEFERIMSDASKPTRKASKKAIMEMERETQRLARQQALAHQMKTKRKFTTSDLFAKFNFRPQGTSAAEPPAVATATLASDSSASSAPNSDVVDEEVPHVVSTPPSSPPTPLDRQKALVDQGALSKLTPVRQETIANLIEINSDDELPDMINILASSRVAKAAPEGSNVACASNSTEPRNKSKLARFGNINFKADNATSDDELEIVDQLPPHLQAFTKAMNSSRARKPADTKALHNLKHLSNLYAQESISKKKGSRPSVNPSILEAQLRRKAKQQARQVQLERIQELKAKGIDILTTEEQEKEAELYEDLLEKARQDAVALRKAEKAAATGKDENAMEASDDEDEDYDYYESGSEDDDEDADADGEDGHEGNHLADDVADETDGDERSDEEEHGGLENEDDSEDARPDPPLQPELSAEAAHDDDNEAKPSMFRMPRKSRVIEDDDDEDMIDAVETEGQMACHPANVAADDEDPFAAFDFGAAGIAPLLSPTQAFNATMRTPTQATQEDSFEIFRRVAPPSISSLASTGLLLPLVSQEESQTSVIPASQIPGALPADLEWEGEAPETPAPAALKRDRSALSETPGWNPTQDDGLPSPWTGPKRVRRESTTDLLEDHETQSTVQLRISESPAASQIVPKRGRLTRRQAAIAADISDDDISALPPQEKNAFRELAKRRREALTAVEKQEAEKEMRQMMDEQAEESEDEYAGLGGDDYVAPETEQDREMIDSSHVEVDEQALAAHYAERERLREEEETSRLYKDLTTGVLRRKMGANAFDLDEDEDELVLRRREMRQREEARKRRALLKDENVATLAEGKQSKGKDAFLKAIADDDGDEDAGSVSDDQEIQSVDQTQDQSHQSQSQPPPLRETSGNKRRFTEVEQTSSGDIVATKVRRVEFSAFRRPTSLLEVKESVSFLLEESNATVALEQPSESDSEYEDARETAEEQDSHISDSDDAVAEEARRNNDGGYAPDRSLHQTTNPPRLPASQRRTTAPVVVDRLSLKRISSASSSESAHSRTAWAAGPTTGGFKVPSLLRRATTSAAASEANDRGVTISRENSTGGTSSGSGVRMGGSKKSSLAYQARAEERKAIVEASARRREENTRRIAAMRRTASAAGLLGRGSFRGNFE